MDFRVRNLKENKQSSNSTIEFPKNIEFLTPKSLDYQRTNTLALLETKLKGFAEAQKADHAHCMDLLSKLQGSVYSLECRIGESDKGSPLAPHTQLAQNDTTTPSSTEDLVLLHNPSLQRPNLPHWQRHPLSHENPFLLNESAGRDVACEGSVFKAIEGLRTQFEGKLKALADRMQLDFNIKTQLDAKIKEEEKKTRLAREQKKAAQTQNKMKTQIEQEMLIKLGRKVIEGTEEITKKAQSSIIVLKKQLMEGLQRDKAACLQQITKAKLELDGRVKARDERIDYNPKRDIQVKKKDEELRARLQSLSKRIEETSKKAKEEAMTEMNEKIALIEGDFGILKRSFDSTKSQLQNWSRRIQELVKQMNAREVHMAKEGQRSVRVQLMAEMRTVKQQVVIINESFQAFRQSIHQKMTTNAANLEEKVFLATSETRSVLVTLNKLEAGLFAEREANKALHQKMSTDILDIADSLAVVVQQMKPYHQ